MLHKFRILVNVFQNCLTRDLSFRFNFLIRMSTDLVWYSLNILFFDIIFINTKNLSGWGLWETATFLGTVFIIDSLHMALFYFNTIRIPGYVRTGMLDSFLLKPVNSRFLISIRNMSISSLCNCIFGVGVVVYSIYKMNLNISVGQILGYIVFLLSGVLIMQSILFIAATTSLFFTKTDELVGTVFDIFQFGMKPDIIYKGVTKIILTFIIPVLIIFNLPAKFLLNKVTFTDSLWGILIAFILVMFSNYFWKIALRSYSGASS